MKSFKVKSRCKTREQRNQSKMFLALAIVSWAIIMAVIIAYLTTLTAEGTSDPVAAEPPIETRKTARDEVEDAPAAEAAFDPVREDIPMDAEHQRLLYRACEETGIRYELALAVIWRETDFRNISGDGGDSAGYMQVQEKWHRDRMERLGVDDLTDPYGNFLVGCDFLAELLESYELEEALTAYNSGKAGKSAYATAVIENMKTLEGENVC